jgi:hypothetical protein
MTGINEFLPFATAPGANVLTPAVYAALPEVATGFVDGKAVTENLNTVWRQSSFIAAAVAQIVANGGLNALDDGNVAQFTSNFISALTAQLPLQVDVTSFNGRTGAVTLTSADVTAALAYVPVAPGSYTAVTALTMNAGKLLGRTTAGIGAAEEISVGSGLSLSAGVLSSTAGGGSVTSVSVVSANGFAGTVVNPSSTPAITLTTGITGALKGVGGALAAATQADTPVIMAGTPTVVTNDKNFYDLSWSAGAVSGFGLTNNGDGTVSIAAGETLLREAASAVSPITSYSIAAVANIALTDNAVNYLYVGYNAGAPTIYATTALSDINCQDKCILYKLARYGTTIKSLNATQQNVDSNQKHRHRYLLTENFHWANGMMITATGTRNIAVTAGELFFGLLDLTTPAFDTSAAGTFTYVYRNGAGGWTRTTGNTQIDNTNYDSGTGTLTALGTGNYGVFWVYEVIDTPTILTVLYGQGNYNTLTLAQAATVPSSLPPELAGLGQIVGRIVIKKAATSFSDVASPFTTSFVPGTATDHASLTSLAWTSSGHTGTLSTLAGFDSANLAAVYTLSGTGTVIPTCVSPVFTTPALGAATATSINGLTVTSSTGTLTLTNGKTLAVSNTLTFAGTDGTTMTFPPASANVGYLEVPQNSQSVAYTCVMADSGKHLLHPAADTTARTFTIPANSSVAYPIGAALTFVNQNAAGVVTIAITTDTMRLAGAGTTGSRTLAANGVATALKITSTEWIISGTGLT